MNDVKTIKVNADQPSFSLVLANIGEAVRISSLRAGKGLNHKMREMGLPVGAEIKVLHRAPNGASIVAKDGLRVALGAGMAHKIHVQLLNNASVSSSPTS